MNSEQEQRRARWQSDWVERWKNPAAMLGAMLPQVNHIGREIPPAERFDGAVPPDLPIALPIPPGGRIVASASRPDRPKEDAPAGMRTHAIVLSVPTDAASIWRFYDEAFPPPRWVQPSAYGRPPWPNQEQQVYCAGVGQPWLEITIGDLTPELAERPVVLQVVTARRGACSDRPDLPMRSDEERAGMYQRVRDAWPNFPRPSIRDLGRRISSDDDSQGDTMFIWDGDVASLAQLLEGQLAEEGWSRTAGEADGGLVWSHWQVPGTRGGVWEGVLYVMGEPDSRFRQVHIRIGLPGAV